MNGPPGDMVFADSSSRLSLAGWLAPDANSAWPLLLLDGQGWLNWRAGGATIG